MPLGRPLWLEEVTKCDTELMEGSRAASAARRRRASPRLLVVGDLAIAHLADGHLRQALSTLLAGEPMIAADAWQIVHDLGPRGALRFHDLLNTSPTGAP